MTNHDTELKALWTSTLTPPNLNANLTLFECHEPLFYTCHESLNQINED
jgi:hypothetical protein